MTHPLSHRSAPRLSALAALIGAAGLAMAASAQPAQPAPVQPAPAAQPADAAATATIILLVDFKGNVHIRRPEKIVEGSSEGWERPRAGMALSQGTQIRTAFGSVRLQVGATQAFTIDKLTSITVREAVNAAGAERTRIDLAHGRMGISVDSTRVANDVQVVTPEQTLAVTGTDLVIEHSSDFGTRSQGAPVNKGSFVIVYNNGATATVTGTEQSSSSTPDPAQARQEASRIDSTDPKTGEADERAAALRAGGTGEAIGLNAGLQSTSTDLFAARQITDTPPAAIANFLAFDQIKGTLFESDLTDRRQTIVESVPVAPGAPFSGLSMIDQPGLEQTVFLLRSDVDLADTAPLARNHLYSLDRTALFPFFTFQTEVGAGSGVLLQGLGSIGTGLYAHGFDLQAEDPVHSVYEIGITSGDVQSRMELPGVSIGGVGGSNERGSLFLGGRLDLQDASDQFVFLEVDPRTNYLINAVGGADSELVPTSGTFVSAGIDPSSIDNISGLAVVDGILVLSATALVNNEVTSVLLQYDPAATNTKSSPRLRRVEAVTDGSFITALASERGGVPRASRELDDSPGPIDLQTINAVFGRMAYGEDALRSDVLQRMVGNEIIVTSRDPAGCAASGALDALPSILRKHVDRTSGVGRSVAEFRSSLPFMHPCGSTSSTSGGG